MKRLLPRSCALQDETISIRVPFRKSWCTTCTLGKAAPYIGQPKPSLSGVDHLTDWEETKNMSMTETASDLGERLSGAKEQVKDLGRTAGEKLDEARHWTAKKVQTAASSVRTVGRHGSEAIDGLAGDTAGKLDATAAYVRSGDARSMFADLRQVIRRHPTGLFVIAAAVGFLVGASIRTKAQSHDE